MSSLPVNVTSASDNVLYVTGSTEIDTTYASLNVNMSSKGLILDPCMTTLVEMILSDIDPVAEKERYLEVIFKMDKMDNLKALVVYRRLLRLHKLLA